MVGIGPGHALDRTRRAENVIRASDLVIGYRPYVERIADLTAGIECQAFGMRQEVERCRLAVEEAAHGRRVALVCSGDPGIYGLAGLAIECALEHEPPVAVEIVPGVTASSAAAAALGAPLVCDYAVISLSDLLVPLERIEKRLTAVLQADMAVVLYNPKSHTRTEPFARAVELALKHRDPATPVGIVHAASEDDQRMSVVRLDDLPQAEVDMRSVVVIPDSTARLVGDFLVTPRGYRR